FDRRLADTLDNPELFGRFADAADGIADLYENRRFAQAVRDIMALADEANSYVNAREPWTIAKDDGRRDELQRICTSALCAFAQLTVYLKPILPETATKAEALLNSEPLQWSDIGTPLTGTTINK